MLHADPVRPFSNTFKVRNGDLEIARLKIGWFSDNGAIRINGREVRLYRERIFSGAFKLELDGKVLAKAYKPSVFHNRFDVEFEGVRIALVRESLVKRSFVVRRGEEILGRIEHESMLMRKARIDLPDEWPTVLQLFVFWLVLIIWKRMNDA